jgi:uncharacterized protein YPO0396
VSDELDQPVTKREVIEAFNRMGQEWNMALGVAHDKIAELTRRLTMAEDTLNYVLSVDARAMSGITKTVFSAVADLKAEVQALQEKAAKDEQITTDDLATVEEKAEYINGAVAGLGQFGSPQPPVSGEEAVSQGE